MRAVVALSIIALFTGFGDASAETCRAAAYPIATTAGYEHDRWVSGAEHGDLRLEFEGFVSAYDGLDDDDADAATLNVLSQPEWVAQEVHRYVEDGMFLYPAGFERPNPRYEFRRFSGIATEDGVTNIELDDSYKGEGTIWNRGHMATRNLVNRISSEAGCNSHTFANAIPQYWSLNQGEWLALENYTGAAANKYDRAWAISGPVFLPGMSIETVGEGTEVRIPIPHAVFKVIVFLADEDTFVRAFLFHQPTYSRVKAIMSANGGKIPLMGFSLCRSTNQDAYDFAPFASTLSGIEELTGITFFPDANPSEKSALDGFSDRPIWRIDRQFYERPCGEEVN